MEEKRVKIELILSGQGYSISAKVDSELTPLEILGLADLLKSETPQHLKVDSKLKLSKKLEKDFKGESDELSDFEKQTGGREISLDNLPEGLQEALSKVLKDKGIKDVKVMDMTGGNLREILQQQDNCNCVVCRIRKGEEVDFNKLSEEDNIKLQEIADREGVSVDQVKKKISEVALKVKLGKEGGKFPMMSNQVGEA